MITTDDHVFFWHGPLSNWHKGLRFGGETAYELAIARLDALGVSRPADEALSSRLLRAATFNCGEQWMMACKVWLCDRSDLMLAPESQMPTEDAMKGALDYRLRLGTYGARHAIYATPLARVLCCPEPSGQKAIGRSITTYDDVLWRAARVACVTAGTIARMSVDYRARKVLLDSGSRTLVEGSPHDRIWGVGLRYDNAAIRDPRNWRGENLLGISHQEARTVLEERFA